MSKDDSTPSVTIEKIKFINGEEITFKTDDIILLVGSNNVGKSQFLKDIYYDVFEVASKKILLDNSKFKSIHFTKENVYKFLESNFEKDIHSNFLINAGSQNIHYINLDHQKIEVENKILLKPFLTFLSTEKRLELTKAIFPNDINRNDALKIWRNLNEEEENIAKLNLILESMFNKSIETSEELINNVNSKIYKIENSEKMEEVFTIDKRKAKKILKDYTNLHQQGDGIRNAVCILSSILVDKSSIFLIDEPEAFMHPPQAKTLGKNIVDLLEGKQCFIATHNIDFIKGILEKKSSRVKIIKIDRIEDENSYHILENDKANKIISDKNLKYTNILNGLFYNRVILTENESDCRFYDEILRDVDNEVAQETLFCGVGGKHQFKKLIPNLKALKIKCNIIADIDIINDKNELQSLLNTIDGSLYNEIKEKHKQFLKMFNESTNSSLKKQRDIKQEINELFTDETYLVDAQINKIKDLLKETSALTLLKKHGKSIIPTGECHELFNEINSFLKNNNVYILESGEIESFIPTVNGHGDQWVTDVFNKYPDINHEVYKDIKQFLNNMIDN